MIYLVDKLDFDILELSNNCFFTFDLFQTTEERVRRWLENERSRSIFSKLEITNLFRIRNKIQMVKVDKIKLNRFDKVIIWTPTGKYFVLEIKNIYKC
jgi:hypothetical protein